MKDACGRVGPQAERARCPRAALRPAPGRSGHQPAGTTTGARGASLQVGMALAGGKPAACGANAQEAWPVAAPWGWNILLGRNRGGTPTGERARQRTGRRKPALIRGAPPCPLARLHATCVCRRSASFVFFLRSPDKRSAIREQRRSVTTVSGFRAAESCGAYAGLRYACHARRAWDLVFDRMRGSSPRMMRIMSSYPQTWSLP